jgi:hypothetical protein
MDIINFFLFKIRTNATTQQQFIEDLVLFIINGNMQVVVVKNPGCNIFDVST